MKNTTRAVSVGLVCILALMMAHGATALPPGITPNLPPPMNGPVINANYPLPNPPLKDNCDYICAEGFTIGGWGAYANRLDLGLVGTNFTVNDPASGTTSVPITCTFKVSITTAFSNGAVGFPVYSQNETVTVPANIGESNVTPVAIPLAQPLPSLYLGAGNYYVMINKGTPAMNGNPSTGCNAIFNGGAQANPPADLDWNLDYLVSVPNVGPGFFGMFHTNPATWPLVQGTFAFDLIGPVLIPPPVGGGTLQIARLVVAGPITPPPGGPVEAQIGFLNAETGALLGPLQQVTLNPGQVESADLNLTPFASRVGQRIEVQPVIVQSPNAAGEVNPGPINISATVQMLDAITGFGTVLAPVPQPGETNPGPVGTPALSPQILAGGQTMRFDVMASPFDACSAQVSFNDGNGVALIPAVQVNLTPGTGTTVDLNADALGLRFGQRTEVQPVLTPTAPLAAVAQNSVCIASVEVFDHLSGRTWSHQSTMVGLPAVQTPAGGTPGTPGTPEVPTSAGTQ